MYGNKQRGENRDYIPSRETIESGQGADLKEGLAMRKTVTQPYAHYRKKSGKSRTAGLDGLIMLEGL